MRADLAHAHTDDARPRVRLRLVWAGLALTLAGLVAVGVGLMALSWIVCVAGAVALAAGVVVGLRGGVLDHAVSVLALRRELTDVRRGRTRPGVAAGDQVREPEASAHAAHAAGTTRTVLAASLATRTSSLARVSGWTLLLIGAAAVVTESAWVSQTTAGHHTSARDAVLLVVVSLCGIRLGFVPARHRVAAVLAALAGAGLVGSGLLAHHSGSGAAVVEVLAGTAAVVAAVVAWLSPWEVAEG